jgi:hypothetical protein
MTPDKDPSALAAFARWGDLALSFGLAAFFGLIRYLQEFLSPGSPPAFKWLIASAKGFTAGAVGMLTHWLLAEWEVRANLAAFLIAVAGYGGCRNHRTLPGGAS